jgi:hypothetical protein
LTFLACFVVNLTVTGTTWVKPGVKYCSEILTLGYNKGNKATEITIPLQFLLNINKRHGKGTAIFGKFKVDNVVE